MIFRQFIFESMKRDPRFGHIYSRVGRHPSWIWKYAGLAAAFIVIPPLIVIVLAGLLTFLAVFFLLGALNSMGNFLGSLGSGSRKPQPAANEPEGRHNVRVIDAEFRPYE